jgi:thiamine-phosphate pyrophosphorylase
MTDPAGLRLLDANANRAREALRLAEDFARFALDDDQLCGTLKAIRHDLVQALPDAVELAAHRDTPGDVGTRLSTQTERRRIDLGHAVVAACKRFGEAARVIEEVLKTADATAAGAVERARYRFYEAERRLLQTLRPRARFAGVRVYVLITESACLGDWRRTAERAVAGGAQVLQLREPDLPAGELLRRAMILRDLCRDTGRLLIVNDRPDVAVLARADGVHVGQDDLPAADARRIVGPRGIVGVSTHEVRQVKQAHLDGADYVGVGPVFPSPTKPRDFLPGLTFAKEAAMLDLLPTVAIAGITPTNAGEVWATGVTAVAVTAAVTLAEDPAAAVAALRPPDPSR